MKGKICLLWLIMISVLAGCGLGSDSDTPPRTSGKKQDYNQNGISDLDQSDENTRREFIFVCPIIDNEYWQMCMQGIKAADKEFGTSTRVVGPQSKENFATEIVGYMEEAIASKPDGIMGYAGIEDMFPLIERASEQGIPFLAIDSDAPDTSRIAYVGTDLYSFGYQAGETLVHLINESGKVGYLCSSFSAQNESLVFGAFLDAISDYDIEVAARMEGGTSEDSAEQAAKAMLKEHPELNAVFCTASFNATGVARVKKEQGLDDLVLVGVDDTDENLLYVREGIINAIMAQSPYQMGYHGVQLLDEYLTMGRLLTDSYDTKSVLVTKENVDTYKE